MDAQDSQVREDGESAFRQKPDGMLDPAGEAGWYLQRERERRGESLGQAGEATGIHPYHVEAIEYGDMTRMPHRLEALEMIGVYAQYLGFDPDPLVQHYALFLPRPPVAPKARHPANPAPLSSAKILSFGKLPRLPRIDFRLPRPPGGPGGLVASLAGAIFLFAGASYMMMPAPDDAAGKPQTAETGDPLATASTGRKPAQIRITQEAMTDDREQAPDELAGTNLAGLAGLIEGQPPSGKIVDRIPVAKPTAAATAAAAGTGGSRLMLKAKAPVWVRIEDAQGNVVMTRMLMKGETYAVPDRQGLVVIARDGGLLSYVIDGKEKGVLGPPGEILVGRPLDIKSLDGNG
ncbi:MAG: helix-turn-helix domain-containing protein [Hyphomicrobiales bacterium]